MSLQDEAATQRAALPFPEHTAHEGTVLFTAALLRTDARGLMEGWAPERAESAQSQLERLLALPSVERQARVAVHFGMRTDAGARLRSLMAEAGPVMEEAVYRVLPPYQRTLFPLYQSRPELSIPGTVQGFAQRLVREAVA